MTSAVERQFVVGFVRSAHGLDGSLKVASASGSYDHIARLKSVTLRKGGESREARVESARICGGFALVKFCGIDSPEAARALVGSDVVVPRSAAKQPKEGEWYIDDLAGCSLVHDGKSVAVITGVMDGGQSPLLDVAVVDGGKKWNACVPFSDRYIGAVDVERKTVELKTLMVLERQ